MKNRILRYLVPRPANNHRARSLHHHWLFVYLVLFLGTQLALNTAAKLVPGVLGFATNIEVESLLDLTNSRRLENGSGTLRLNPALSKAAYEKGLDMMTKDYWAHTSPDGIVPWYWIKKNGYEYTFAGENLARDFDDSVHVVEAWMKSPAHRDNLLNSNYEDIGLAVVNGNFNGLETTLVVQMFGASKGQKVDLALKPEQIGGKAPAGGSGVEMAKPTQEVLVAGLGVTKPKIDVFQISKRMALYFGVILLGVLAVDEVFLHWKGLVRTTGHNWGHGLILGFMLAVSWLLTKGAIL